MDILTNIDLCWLDPKPTEPLYLVAFRSIHLYLQEYSELEDIGLTDPSGGVVRILSDVTHWKRKPYEGTLKPAFVDAGLPSAQKYVFCTLFLCRVLISKFQ